LVETYIDDGGDDGYVGGDLMKCDAGRWRSMKKEERSCVMVMENFDVFRNPKSCG
jgi:hypothetical protein